MADKSNDIAENKPADNNSDKLEKLKVNKRGAREQSDDMRKSLRKKRPRLSYSPDRSEGSAKRKQKCPKRNPYSATGPNRSCDRLPNGDPFSCHLCSSPFVVNRKSKKYLKDRHSKHHPLPFEKKDPVSGNTLMLCNACYLMMIRRKSKSTVKKPSTDEKEKYIESCKAFSKLLAEKLQQPEANRLYCPEYKKEPCRCIQKYIRGKGDAEADVRARELCDMLLQSLRLSKLKCYQLPEINTGSETQKKRKSVVIGLGNGQKRSRAFEAFVLEKRQYLKGIAGLCERGTQKVLAYSNNFLHKRLKTEEESCRVKLQRGRCRMGLLPSFDDLARKKCCVDNCVKMADTHRRLLNEWRERAKKSQAEARRVIAEMLVPAAGCRLNCYSFINMVTGSSRSTISKVSIQIVETGGEREPPEHGLSKYWKEHQNKGSSSSQPVTKRKTQTVTVKPKSFQMSTASSTQNDVSMVTTSITAPISHTSQSTLPNSGVDLQRQQLLQLQQMFEHQQQQLLQQQLLQHSLINGQMDNSAQNVAMIQQMIDQLSAQLMTTQVQLQQSLQQLLAMGSQTDQQNQIVQSQLSQSSTHVTETQVVHPTSSYVMAPQTRQQSYIVTGAQGNQQSTPIIIAGPQGNIQTTRIMIGSQTSQQTSPNILMAPQANQQTLTNIVMGTQPNQQIISNFTAGQTPSQQSTSFSGLHANQQMTTSNIPGQSLDHQAESSIITGIQANQQKTSNIVIGSQNSQNTLPIIGQPVSQMATGSIVVATPANQTKHIERPQFHNFSPGLQNSLHGTSHIIQRPHINLQETHQMVIGDKASQSNLLHGVNEPQPNMKTQSSLAQEVSCVSQFRIGSEKNLKTMQQIAIRPCISQHSTTQVFHLSTPTQQIIPGHNQQIKTSVNSSEQVPVLVYRQSTSIPDSSSSFTNKQAVATQCNNSNTHLNNNNETLQPTNPKFVLQATSYKAGPNSNKNVQLVDNNCSDPIVINTENEPTPHYHVTSSHPPVLELENMDSNKSLSHNVQIWTSSVSSSVHVNPILSTSTSKSFLPPLNGRGSSSQNITLQLPVQKNVNIPNNSPVPSTVTTCNSDDVMYGSPIASNPTSKSQTTTVQNPSNVLYSSPVSGLESISLINNELLQNTVSEHTNRELQSNSSFLSDINIRRPALPKNSSKTSIKDGQNMIPTFNSNLSSVTTGHEKRIQVHTISDPNMLLKLLEQTSALQNKAGISACEASKSVGPSVVLPESVSKGMSETTDTTLQDKRTETVVATLSSDTNTRRGVLANNTNIKKQNSSNQNIPAYTYILNPNISKGQHVQEGIQTVMPSEMTQCDQNIVTPSDIRQNISFIPADMSHTGVTNSNSQSPPLVAIDPNLLIRLCQQAFSFQAMDHNKDKSNKP